MKTVVIRKSGPFANPDCSGSVDFTEGLSVELDDVFADRLIEANWAELAEVKPQAPAKAPAKKAAAKKSAAKRFGKK